MVVAVVVIVSSYSIMIMIIVIVIVILFAIVMMMMMTCFIAILNTGLLLYYLIASCVFLFVSGRQAVFLDAAEDTLVLTFSWLSVRLDFMMGGVVGLMGEFSSAVIARYFLSQGGCGWNEVISIIQWRGYYFDRCSELWMPNGRMVCAHLRTDIIVMISWKSCVSSVGPWPQRRWGGGWKRLAPEVIERKTSNLIEREFNSKSYMRCVIYPNVWACFCRIQ